MRREIHQADLAARAGRHRDALRQVLHDWISEADLTSCDHIGEECSCEHLCYRPDLEDRT